MNDMIACCGRDCSKCEAYIATQKDDDIKREEVARKWMRKHGGQFTADQVNCDGCQADGRVPDWVANQCPIRKCCRGKAVGTCAQCDEYPCEQLKSLKATQKAKANLEELR